MTQLTDLQQSLIRTESCLRALAVEFPELAKMPNFTEACFSHFLAVCECADLVESQGVTP